MQVVSHFRLQLLMKLLLLFFKLLSPMIMLAAAVPVSGLGYVVKVKTFIGPPDEKGRKRNQKLSFLPASVLYLHRNVDLRCLNYHEFISCVQFVNQAPRQSAPSNSHLQVHFPLHEQFIEHENFPSRPASKTAHTPSSLVRRHAILASSPTP